MPFIWDRSMGSTYYTYYKTLLWPWLVTGGTAGLSFCDRCVLLIDEVDELHHKLNKSGLNLVSLKRIQMQSSKQRAT